MAGSRETGQLGEAAVAGYLEEEGYSILERNFKRAGGEIDLIAAGKGYILFVEVKTRGKNPLAAPRYAVTRAKQLRIISTAQKYLMEREVDLQPRFDVAEVYLEDGRVKEINYLENAFFV